MPSRNDVAEGREALGRHFLCADLDQEVVAVHFALCMRTVSGDIPFATLENLAPRGSRSRPRRRRGRGAHAQDVALALGHADRLARIEQVEDVRRLQRLLVGRQRQRHLEQRLAVLLALVELGEERGRVRVLEIVCGLLDFVLVIDVAVSHAALRAVGPGEVVDAFDALQVHREALEAVGDLAHHGPAVEPARLLEVRELRDLHAVQPDFPAESPGAERRRFPVVLDEADVVHQRVDADRARASRSSAR